MNVVVTGGTGFIGRKLVDALSRRGDRVVVLSRGSDGGQAFPAGVETRTWSGRGTDGLSAVDEADAVVHLAGAGVLDKRWTKERLEVIRSSRVGPTAWLADALARSPRGASGVSRTWVSASAIGIYGMRTDDLVRDEQAAHGDDVLAEICEAWEAATASAMRAGVRVAIPRFGIVLGTEGGALAKMLPAFRAFMGGPVGNGRQWVSWVHWRDVVGALLFAVDRPELVGPFNVCAPKPVTMNELAEDLGKALGRPAVVRAPAFAVRLALGPAADVVLTGQRAVPARLERGGFVFAFESLAPALADLLV